jgi:hypothetical protein
MLFVSLLGINGQELYGREPWLLASRNIKDQVLVLVLVLEQEEQEEECLPVVGG